MTDAISAVSISTQLVGQLNEHLWERFTDTTEPVEPGDLDAGHRKLCAAAGDRLLRVAARLVAYGDGVSS